MNLNKKKILITGSKGFIGQNFFNYLKKYKEYEIYGFARENILGDLEILINKVDVVFHFAGVNRSCRIKDFHEVNIDFSKRLCELLKRNSEIRLVYASSIQVNKDNAYGITKKKGEEICLNLAKENNNKVHILRLPGVFGPNCKPNYNSVVATYCYNVLNNLELKIINRNRLLELVYIEDLCYQMRQLIMFPNKDTFVKINSKYKIKVHELASIIKSFKYENNMKIGDLNNKLYKTFITYK